MKRTLLCILSLLMTIIIKAGDVTPEVAMKQALSLVLTTVPTPFSAMLTVATSIQTTCPRI